MRAIRRAPSEGRCHPQDDAVRVQRSAERVSERLERSCSHRASIDIVVMGAGRGRDRTSATPSCLPCRLAGAALSRASSDRALRAPPRDIGKPARPSPTSCSAWRVQRDRTRRPARRRRSSADGIKLMTNELLTSIPEQTRGANEKTAPRRSRARSRRPFPAKRRCSPRCRRPGGAPFRHTRTRRNAGGGPRWRYRRSAAGGSRAATTCSLCPAAAAAAAQFLWRSVAPMAAGVRRFGRPDHAPFRA